MSLYVVVTSLSFASSQVATASNPSQSLSRLPSSACEETEASSSSHFHRGPTAIGEEINLHFMFKTNLNCKLELWMKKERACIHLKKIAIVRHWETGHSEEWIKESQFWKICRFLDWILHFQVRYIWCLHWIFGALLKGGKRLICCQKKWLIRIEF